MTEQQAAQLLEVLKAISQSLGTIAEKMRSVNDNLHVLTSAVTQNRPMVVT
jgi:hypothetical protein